jgi:hypothetical protein
VRFPHTPPGRRSTPTLCGIGVACLSCLKTWRPLRFVGRLQVLHAFWFVRGFLTYLGVALSHSGEWARLHLGEHVASRALSSLRRTAKFPGWHSFTSLGLALQGGCGKVGPCRLAHSNIPCAPPRLHITGRPTRTRNCRRRLRRKGCGPVASNVSPHGALYHAPNTRT